MTLHYVLTRDGGVLWSEPRWVRKGLTQCDDARFGPTRHGHGISAYDASARQFAGDAGDSAAM